MGNLSENRSERLDFFPTVCMRNTSGGARCPCTARSGPRSAGVRNTAEGTRCAAPSRALTTAENGAHGEDRRWLQALWRGMTGPGSSLAACLTESFETLALAARSEPSAPHGAASRSPWRPTSADRTPLPTARHAWSEASPGRPDFSARPTGLGHREANLWAQRRPFQPRRMAAAPARPTSSSSPPSLRRR